MVPLVVGANVGAPVGATDEGTPVGATDVGDDDVVVGPDVGVAVQKGVGARLGLDDGAPDAGVGTSVGDAVGELLALEGVSVPAGSIFTVSAPPASITTLVPSVMLPLNRLYMSMVPTDDSVTLSPIVAGAASTAMAPPDDAVPSVPSVSPPVGALTDRSPPELRLNWLPMARAPP